MYIGYVRLFVQLFVDAHVYVCYCEYVFMCLYVYMMFCMH